MDRLPNESAPAFEAFRTYCEQGADRSIRNVSQKVCKNTRLIAKWSVRHRWVERAADYDRHLERIAQKAEEAKLVKAAGLWAKRIGETREEAFQTAMLLVEKAEAMLKFPLAETVSADGKTVVKPGRWTFADAARLLDVASRLKQLATGLPTERYEHSGPEGQPLPAAGPQVIFYVPGNGRDEKGE